MRRSRTRKRTRAGYSGSEGTFVPPTPDNVVDNSGDFVIDDFGNQVVMS